MEKVELRTINADNFEECIRLKVSDAQKSFVASNIYSLAQAWVYYKTAWPFAIYAGDTMVGFVMLGFYAEKSQYTIWRFMIDARFQNKGYGRAALTLAIQYLSDEHHVGEIYLSYEPDNIVAEKLYESFGFVKTGEVCHGELEMRLAIKNR